MTEVTIINPSYSTTRTVTRQQPVIEKQAEDKFETVLFLPEGEDRQGEGGLRAQGYFKTSLEGKPLITVITVVFNGEKFLEETIQSIINQTYENVEYIIIDGGSTDGTLDIIKRHEGKIDYWISEKDKGIYDAMNKGIRLCSGNIIGIVNADDYLYLDTIFNIANIYVKKIFNYTYGSLDCIDGQKKKYKIISIGTNNIKYKVFSHMPYLHPTMFCAKTMYKALGLYDVGCKLSADYDFIFKIDGAKYQGVELNFKTGCFRLGGASGGIESIKENHRLLLKHKKNYFLVWLNTFILTFKLRIRNLKK